MKPFSSLPLEVKGGALKIIIKTTRKERLLSKPASFPFYIFSRTPVEEIEFYYLHERIRRANEFLGKFLPVYNKRFSETSLKLESS